MPQQKSLLAPEYLERIPVDPLSADGSADYQVIRKGAIVYACASCAELGAQIVVSN